MITSYTSSNLLRLINISATNNSIPKWPAAHVSRDSLVEYVRNGGGIYDYKGVSPFKIDENVVRESCPAYLIWEEIGGPLIDHASNIPVFDSFINLISRSNDDEFLLWFDGPLFDDETEDVCIVINPREWNAIKEEIGKEYPWWLSFDTDKILFAADFSVMLVAFHHDCFELASFSHNIDELWGSIKDFAISG